jgi:hypothetical protein
MYRIGRKSLKVYTVLQTLEDLYMGKFVYQPKYAVIVMCKDETEQKAIFDKLKKMGLTIKVVSV